MNPLEHRNLENQNLSRVPEGAPIDYSKARAAYQKATQFPNDRHAEVGILSPEGTASIERLGLNEAYGAHRIGSVTKTFTAFLALKLVNNGTFPNGLQTKCSEVIPSEALEKVFKAPDLAREMTLEQLLSHTSGLDLDDHCRDQVGTPFRTIHDRFLAETEQKEGYKYQHVCKPGDRIGFYSNGGLAVAGWLMELAYNNKNKQSMSFAEIMKKEIFEDVFKLSDSVIAPGPSGDNIQSACGDMTSTTEDLIKVAQRLQGGEASLDATFGSGWQSTMMKPRDIFGEHGLGCAANSKVIQHFGMNREQMGPEIRDVTAVVEFPLNPREPGLVAMCDSCALGPQPNEQVFIRELEICAGIINPEKPPERSEYKLEFFCPSNPHVFFGNGVLLTDVDPFSQNVPDNIVCSRNGMKHELSRDPSKDSSKNDTNITAYKDENGKPWLFIEKNDGTKIIYSDLCLQTKALGQKDLLSLQPAQTQVEALTGVYKDAEKPNEHSTFTFEEKQGRLYLKEDEGDSHPCLFIPDDKGGSWVVSNPTGRKINIKFPENPDEQSLFITDFYTGIQQMPYYSTRKLNSSFL